MINYNFVFIRKKYFQRFFCDVWHTSKQKFKIKNFSKQKIFIKYYMFVYMNVYKIGV